MVDRPSDSTRSGFQSRQIRHSLLVGCLTSPDGLDEQRHHHVLVFCRLQVLLWRVLSAYPVRPSGTAPVFPSWQLAVRELPEVRLACQVSGSGSYPVFHDICCIWTCRLATPILNVTGVSVEQAVDAIRRSMPKGETKNGGNDGRNEGRMEWVSCSIQILSFENER